MSDRPPVPELSQTSDGTRRPPAPPAASTTPDTGRPGAQGVPTTPFPPLAGACPVPNLPPVGPEGTDGEGEQRASGTTPVVQSVAPVKLAPVVQPAAITRPVAPPVPEARPVTAPPAQPVPEAEPAAAAVIRPVAQPVPETRIAPGPPVPGDLGPPLTGSEVATVVMPPLGPVPPRAVPSLDDVPMRRPDPGGTADPRTDVGPMFPDLFQQAVAGSRLADTITVHFADGEHRESLDVPSSHGPIGDDQFLVSAAGPGEVGAFTGASARKRRWRL